MVDKNYEIAARVNKSLCAKKYEEKFEHVTVLLYSGDM